METPYAWIKEWIQYTPLRYIILSVAWIQIFYNMIFLCFYCCVSVYLFLKPNPDHGFLSSLCIEIGSEPIHQPDYRKQIKFQSIIKIGVIFNFILNWFNLITGFILLFGVFNDNCNILSIWLLFSIFGVILKSGAGGIEIWIAIKQDHLARSNPAQLENLPKLFYQLLLFIITLMLRLYLMGMVLLYYLYLPFIVQ